MADRCPQPPAISQAAGWTGAAMCARVRRASRGLTTRACCFSGGAGVSRRMPQRRQSGTDVDRQSDARNRRSCPSLPLPCASGRSAGKADDIVVRDASVGASGPPFVVQKRRPLRAALTRRAVERGHNRCSFDNRGVWRNLIRARMASCSSRRRVIRRRSRSFIAGTSRRVGVLSPAGAERGGRA